MAYQGWHVLDGRDAGCDVEYRGVPSVTAIRRLVVGLCLVGSLAVGLPDVTADARSWQIYPLGDSITYGSTFMGVATPGGYRGPLHNLLSRGNLAHRFVGSSTSNSNATLTRHNQTHHDGHSGYRVEQVNADLDGLAGANSDNGGSWLTGIPGRAPIYPDIVVIHLGTNDIYQRFDPGYTYPTPSGTVDYNDSGQRATFVSHLTARLRALVDKIFRLRPSARIVLSNVVPAGVTNPDRVTTAYAGAVQSLAGSLRAANKRVVFADVWHAFTRTLAGTNVIVPGLLGPDQVHPTPSGYRVIAQVYREAVARVIKL